MGWGGVGGVGWGYVIWLWPFLGISMFTFCCIMAERENDQKDNDLPLSSWDI